MVINKIWRIKANDSILNWVILDQMFFSFYHMIFVRYFLSGKYNSNCYANSNWTFD